MRKYKTPTVTRCRARCMMCDYLVRFDGHRAILVSMVSAMELIGPMTEFEIYWLAVYAANVSKKKGWKIICIDVRTYGVFARNPSLSEYFPIGQLKEITEPDHFLNDGYYSPPGFWIKPSTGCNT